MDHEFGDDAVEGGVFEAEVVGAGGGGDLALFAGAEEAEAGGC